MFGRKSKIRKAVKRAIAGVEAENDLADYAPIEALPPDMHAQAFGWTALALFDDERYRAAHHSLERALALAPDEVDLNELAARIATEMGDIGEAIVAQQRVVAARPRDMHRSAALADMMISAERIADVIELLQPLRHLEDPMLEAKLAEALYLSGKHQQALAILDPICAHYDSQLKQLSAADWQALKSRADDASRLRDSIYAEVHGHEATIELHAKEGRLDASAGVNYKLLGARLAVSSPRITGVLKLEDPDTTERRGRVVLTHDPQAATGLVLVGIAQLRRGEVGEARKTFERACEADGRCFAAFLGLGAALDCDKHHSHRRASQFALPAKLPSELERVVPDFGVLTDAERRIVWASVQPFAKLMPTLVERGVKMQILPIDVRATDVDLFEDAAGGRARDHRSYAAISGIATHGGAVAKIEELLDIGEHGWTFAHELAHLVFFHLDEKRARPLRALYDLAVDVGYANVEYALSNVDEFFAVGYADYLRDRYDLPGAPHADDAGVQHALAKYFDSLCA